MNYLFLSNGLNVTILEHLIAKIIILVIKLTVYNNRTQTKKPIQI